MQYHYAQLTEQITRTFYVVYRNLGRGFSERVYANALAIALERAGHRADQKVPVKVYYAGRAVGLYYADMIVDDLVVVEVQASAQLLKEQEAKLFNHLKAIPYEVGLLVNFGPAPEIKRKTFANRHKPNLPASLLKR
jgi:GxxExxY protein